MRFCMPSDSENEDYFYVEFLTRWPLNLLGMKFSQFFHLVPIPLKNFVGQETLINDLIYGSESL